MANEVSGDDAAQVVFVTFAQPLTLLDVKIVLLSSAQERLEIQQALLLVNS